LKSLGCRIQLESLGCRIQLESLGCRIQFESLGCRIQLESLGCRIQLESLGCRIQLESLGCRVQVEPSISQSCQTLLTVNTMIYGSEKRYSKKRFDRCALLIIRADDICVSSIYYKFSSRKHSADSQLMVFEFLYFRDKPVPVSGVNCCLRIQGNRMWFRWLHAPVTNCYPEDSDSKNLRNARQTHLILRK